MSQGTSGKQNIGQVADPEVSISKHYLLNWDLSCLSDTDCLSHQSLNRGGPQHTFNSGQLVKNLPARRETWVRSVCWADPLEKGKATHSSLLTWRIPWTYSPWGRRVEHDWATFTQSIDSKGSRRNFHCINERRYTLTENSSFMELTSYTLD